MVKAVIFDLDGVLVDSKEIHYHALNSALAEIAGDGFRISFEDQALVYEGLTTRAKLEILTKLRGLDSELYEDIWRKKQEYSSKEFASLEVDNKLVSLFSSLRFQGLKVGVVSNSIRSTLDSCLEALGIIKFVDVTISNEDVTEPKPSPAGYIKCMEELGVVGTEAIIFEDSFVGKTAAWASGAGVVSIRSREDLSSELVRSAVDGILLNILIPMAGLGSRFATAGYANPKPLIDVQGAPMIQRVVENLGFSVGVGARYIFIVQREHYEKYNLEVVLNGIAPECSVVQIDGLTEGAAVTSLFAADLIDSDVPLVIANSDQIVLGGWDGTSFIRDASLTGQDGSIVCFKAEDRNPKWSYANVGYARKVLEVAEKRAISDWATVGIYWWRRGSDYVKYAKQMIDRGVRTNGEFYIAPVFNEALADGLGVVSYNVDEMWGIGTPEDLEKYLEHTKNRA